MSSPHLSDLTTLRLGGPVTSLVRALTSDDVVSAISDADAAGTPTLIVGGGSNLIISDAGFAGTAIVIATNSHEFGFDAGRPHVTADAGVAWDNLVAASVDAGFGGLECLSGIPGSTGATPVQNVGAYGVEVADVLREVTLYDRREQTIETVEPSALDLAYRTSNLKHRDERIVLSVSLWLNDNGVSQPLRYRELATALGVAEGETADAAKVREHVLALRRSKGMVSDPADHDTWSAGSFFTNPVVAQDKAPEILDRIRAKVGADVRIPNFPAPGGVKLSAGWLIERAGFHRGYPGDDASVRLSTKHTLALTNRGTGTTAELLVLARDVRAGVEDAFGVLLIPEPVLIGCEL